MGQKVTHFSDLDGSSIEGEPCTMVVYSYDKRRGQYVLDITEEQFEEFRSKGRKTGLRNGESGHHLSEVIDMVGNH